VYVPTWKEVWETLRYSHESVVEKCPRGFSYLALHFMLRNKQLYDGPFEGVMLECDESIRCPRGCSVLKFPRLFADVFLSPKN